MKAILKFIFIVVLPGICSPLHSQTLDPLTVKNTSTVGGNEKIPDGSGGFDQASSGYQLNYLDLGKECGMYLCEDWMPGTIALKDGAELFDRMVRYNIYHQQMEYAYSGDTSAIGNPEELSHIVMDGKKFVFRDFYCGEKKLQGYFELMVSGEYELLLHRGIKYVYEEAPEDSPGKGPITRYFQLNRYFLSCHGNIAEPLPDNKNAIIAMLDKDEKELQKYVKENKCKLKSQDEIVDFFVFVNTH